MARRTLTFHEKDVIGEDKRIGPTYYIEADSEPLAVRIHAENAPPDGDLEVDIFDDGISIFSNHAASHQQAATTKGPTVKYDTAKTAVGLSKGFNTEVLAANFLGSIIEQGSWVHCEAKDTNGGKNVSVHLELLTSDEEDEE